MSTVSDWIKQAFNTLLCWLEWVAKAGLWCIVSAVNLILEVLATIANAAIALLPDSQLQKPTLESNWVGTINYFVPLGPIIGMIAVLVAAWAAYRVYRHLFGWWA